MSRLVFLCSFLLLAFSANAQKSVSPDNWFLDIPSELVDKVKADFGVTLDEGLYYSNQRVAWHRDDVQRGHLIDEVIFEMEDIGDGSISLGWSRKKLNTAPELWLITSSKLRFFLGNYVNGNWVGNAIATNYLDWFPVLGGVAVIENNWRLSLIDLQNSKSVKTETKIELFRKEIDGLEIPFYYYDRITNRMVVASIKDKKANVLAFDLANFAKKTLLPEISWPFFIRNGGIFYTSGTNNESLHYKAFNLTYFNDPRISTIAKDVYKLRANLDSYDFSDSSFYLIRKNPAGQELKYDFDNDGNISRYRGDRSRFSPSTRREDELMASIEHENILSDLILGRNTPVYGLNEISRFLSDQMGSEVGTWAMLRYKKGQMPEELVSQFIWDIYTKVQGSTLDLEDLDRVWSVDAEKVFSGLKIDEVTDMLIAMRDAVDKKAAILVLHDLPTLLESETGATTPIVKAFYSVFRDCTELGTCRVITTIREPVFKNFNKSIPDILRESAQYVVPVLSKDQRESVSLSVLSQHETRKGVKVVRNTFNFVLNFIDKLGRTQESPLNEVHLIKSLFTFVDTYYPSVLEVNRQVGKSWVEHIRGIDVIRKNVDIEGLRKFLKKKIVGHDETIDEVCEGLLPLVNGTHFSAKPLGFFTFTGTPGVGKTYIAKLIAEYITGRDSLLLVDMKTFNGFPSDHPVRSALGTSKNNIRVVLFDDVDQVSASHLDLLAGVVEEGRFAQGSDLELSFSNTIVLWTSNWGEDLIRDGHVTPGNFRKVMRRHLTTSVDGKKPFMKKRIWSRIESNLHVMWPFSEKELFELALVHTLNHQQSLFDISGIDLKVDPRLLLKQVAYESDAQAGARSILNQLEANIFSHYQRVLAKEGVDSICMLQVNADVEVYSNLDEDFDLACAEIEEITEENIDEYLRRFGGGFSTLLPIIAEPNYYNLDQLF